MQTSQKSIFDIIEETSTSSPEASPANPTAPQANDLEKKMTATSGLKCCDAFERFPRVGSWAKTFSALLIGMEGWSSMRCRLTWKLKGTKSNRLFFQLQASTLPTEGIESGLLLTPTSVMTDEPPEKMRERAERNGYKNGTQYGSLLSQVKYSGMLPTPTAGDGMRGVNANTTTMENGRFVRTSKTTGTKFGATLGSAAATGMLPTPTASCANGGTKAPRKDGKTRESELNHWATINRDEAQATGKTSQLNPQFVEEMMGFPENWTASPFLSGETKASKPTGTP